jgi:TPR repeat protein
VWLWRAVSKHNLPAVLLLADLYARGEGVPRSCDQARVLLTAALKRGSVEATQRLQELQRSGCSER